MPLIIGIMLSGLIIGYLIRNRKILIVHKLITALIWILLLLLGMDVGSNDAITSNIYTIGLDAVIITTGAVVGSVLASWILWKVINKTNRP